MMPTPTAQVFHVAAGAKPAAYVSVSFSKLAGIPRGIRGSAADLCGRASFHMSNRR